MSETLRSQDGAENPEKNSEYRERLKHWNEWEKYFKEIDIDEDEPVGFDENEEESINLDEKIRELVIGLNVAGIKTYYSCEGHFKGVGQITKENDKEIENPPMEGFWSHPYVCFRLDKWNEHEISAVLQSFIDYEYYREYFERSEALPEIRVRVRKREPGNYANYEITASDADSKESISGSEDYKYLEKSAKERLRAEQKEIIGFGEFLKKRYLETGFHI